MNGEEAKPPQHRQHNIRTIVHGDLGSEQTMIKRVAKSRSKRRYTTKETVFVETAVQTRYT